MNASETALLLVDLQNDFIHPEGAYGRAGQGAASIAALPGRLAPLTAKLRGEGVLVAATLFTLVPGRGGAPLISPHLQRLRPFLDGGDFQPGSWGQMLVQELAPADVVVEKIAYSAFFNTRLDWVLRRCGISSLIVGGIVTNGGVASTVREAQVRDYEVTVLEDGCAAFSEETHRAAIEGLRGIARIATVAEMLG
jgi:nicotinamidase-related amidase